ncbi:MAG TPA: hypothetical protein VGB98_16360, partial [Pyrinomonadaceae bacterium]
MFSFAPFSKTLPKWPQKLLPEDSRALEEIGFTDFDIVQDDEAYETSGKIGWLKEIELPLPALDSVSLVLLHNNGMTEVAFTYRRRPDFEVRLVNLNVSLRLKKSLLRRVHLVDGKWEPMLLPDGKPAPVDITLGGTDVSLTADWDIAVINNPAVTIPAVELGTTGIVLELSEIELYLSGKQTPPPGEQQGFKGVFIKSAELHLTGGLTSDVAPDNFSASDLLIGSSGISGTITATWNSNVNTNVAAKFAAAGSGGGGGQGGSLFGIPFKLKSLELELKHNQFQRSAIKGELTLPFFDSPADVEVSIDADGGFAVELDGTGPDGLKTLTKPGILELTLDSIGFKVKGGEFEVKLSGAV